MASERDDGERGQVLLLAGILIVLAFIQLNILLSLAPALGQQLGRDVENPLSKEHGRLRTVFVASLQDELRDSGGVVQCPDDLAAYQDRVEGIFSQIQVYESARGRFFQGEVLGLAQVDPTTLEVEVRFRYALDSGHLIDEATLTIDCGLDAKL